MENDFKSFIESLTAIQAIHDEESLETGLAKLQAISVPKEDPAEMGSAFKEAIGYNPITYYNERVIDKVMNFVDARCSEYPTLRHRLQTMKPVITKSVLADLEKARTPNVASVAWGYIRDQIADTDEIPKFELNRLKSDFDSEFHIIQDKPKDMDEEKEKDKGKENPKPKKHSILSDDDDDVFDMDFDSIDDDDDGDYGITITNF